MTNNEGGPALTTPDHPTTETTTTEPISEQGNAAPCDHSDERCPAWLARQVLGQLTAAAEKARRDSPLGRRADAARRLPPYHCGPTIDGDGLRDRDPLVTAW